jgi:hypothetical protein
MKKKGIYFFTASLTVFSQSPQPPAGAWEWAKLIAACLTGGLIAIRALESQPDKTQPDTGSPNI